MFAAKSPIETKIVRMFWNDGLLDLLSGAGVLFIGISWLWDWHVMGAIAPALLVPLWKPIRQRFTEPYLGLVEFSDRQQFRNRSFLVVAIVLGILSLILATTLYFAVVKQSIDFDLKRIVQGLPTGLLGLMAIMTGTATSLNRFYAYGGLLMMLGMAAVILQSGPAWPLIVGGAVILLSGGVVMQRFLKHVRSKAGMDQESKSDV